MRFVFKSLSPLTVQWATETDATPILGTQDGPSNWSSVLRGTGVGAVVFASILSTVPGLLFCPLVAAGESAGGLSLGALSLWGLAQGQVKAHLTPGGRGPGRRGGEGLGLLLPSQPVHLLNVLLHGVVDPGVDHGLRQDAVLRGVRRRLGGDMALT